MVVLGTQTEQAVLLPGDQELLGGLARSILPRSLGEASSVFTGSFYGASDFLERRRRLTA